MLGENSFMASVVTLRPKLSNVFNGEDLIMLDSKCQYRPCYCQRFRASDKDDECLYCGHSIGFHEFKDVDTSEHPFGNCAQCYCQRFKKAHNDPLRCHYCCHYDGNHVSWPTIPANFGPTQPQQSTSPTGNTSRVGRPTADKLTINYLICLTSNKLPKNGTKAWRDLKSKNLIVENVEFSKTDTPDDIYNKIRNLFGGRFQTFQLYRVRSGKPVETNEGFSIASIKSNITKQHKKLYIGPTDTANSPSEAISNETTSVPSHESSNTVSEIQNLPRQSSSDPNILQFFNGGSLYSHAWEQ